MQNWPPPRRPPTGSRILRKKICNLLISTVIEPNTTRTTWYSKQLKEHPNNLYTKNNQSTNHQRGADSLIYTTWPWMGTIDCALRFSNPCNLVSTSFSLAAITRFRQGLIIQLQLNPSFKRATAQSGPIVISNKVETTLGAHSGSMGGCLHALLEITRSIFCILFGFDSTSKFRLNSYSMQ